MKLYSRRPLPNSCTNFCSSTRWNAASCVKRPSDSVRRTGLVIPLLVDRECTTEAFWRKAAIWSRVTGAAGAAWAMIAARTRESHVIGATSGRATSLLAREARYRAYLNRSSNAFLAPDALLGDTDDFVSRSTVVRGSKCVHSLRTSFGDTRAAIGRWHSNAADVSKWTHWAQLCRS